MFFTTKENSIGLGLCLVNRIIGLHNGNIIIESERDKGTIVTCKLPVVQNNT